jgi:hypothetical protein
LLLAKALQYLEVKPDALSPPVLGVAQPSPRFFADPSLHPENHDLMQPHAGDVELGLEIGLRGPRPEFRPRYTEDGDGAPAGGEELELSGVVHTRSLIIPRIQTSNRPSA